MLYTTALTLQDEHIRKCKGHDTSPNPTQLLSRKGG